MKWSHLWRALVDILSGCAVRCEATTAALDISATDRVIAERDFKAPIVGGRPPSRETVKGW